MFEFSNLREADDLATITSMAPLGANVVPAHEGLPACVPAGRGGEGARQLVRALAAGTVANLRQRTRRARP